MGMSSAFLEDRLIEQKRFPEVGEFGWQAVDGNW